MRGDGDEVELYGGPCEAKLIQSDRFKGASVDQHRCPRTSIQKKKPQYSHLASVSSSSDSLVPVPPTRTTTCSSTTALLCPAPPICDGARFASAICAPVLTADSLLDFLNFLMRSSPARRRSPSNAGAHKIARGMDASGEEDEEAVAEEEWGVAEEEIGRERWSSGMVVAESGFILSQSTGLKARLSQHVGRALPRHCHSGERTMGRA